MDKHESIGWPMGRIAAFHALDGLTYARGDASEAYRRSMRRADRHIQTLTRPGMPTHTIWVDDIEADGQAREFTLLLHTAAGNRFEIRTPDHVVVHGVKHRMCLRAASDSSFVIEQDMYCNHPRLMIKLRAIRGRLCLALAPGAESIALTARFEDESVTARLELNGSAAEHTIPCGLLPWRDGGARLPVGEVRLS